MGSWSVVFQCFFVSVGPRNGSPSATNVILVVVIVVVGVVVVIIAYLGSAKAFSFHNRSSPIKVRIQTGDTILMSQQLNKYFS